MDTKKLATIPPAAGGRSHGRGNVPRLGVGYTFAHSVVDDHGRLAYSEPLPDEKAPTVVAFTIRALQYYREYGITHIQEIMTDNHPGYTHSLRFRALPRGRGIKHLTIKPHKPSTERQCGTLPPNPQTQMGQPASPAQRRNRNPGPPRLPPLLPQPPTPHQPPIFQTSGPPPFPNRKGGAGSG